eukprot:s4067_g6.t1
MWNDATLSLFLHRLCKLKAPKVLIFAVLLLYWSKNVTIRADASWLIELIVKKSESRIHPERLVLYPEMIQYFVLTKKDAETMAQLQQEQQMLLQKQQELNRKMNMLQAAKPADVPSRASTEQETEEPEQSSEEGDDNDPDQGDWGLGTVISLDALKQRLRRACRRRKNGKVPGGEAALEAYQDVENRKHLAKLLVDAKFNEDR